MLSTRVLIVEPDGAFRERLRTVAARFGRVDGDAECRVAREHLLSTSYDWVVTNIRLAAYNGLYLTYLAAAARRSARFVVYGGQQDVQLAREAQRAGAFYEARNQVHRALAAYLGATLPPHDRRKAAVRDRRRMTFRGGCRCTDAMESEASV